MQDTLVYIPNLLNNRWGILKVLFIEGSQIPRPERHAPAPIISEPNFRFSGWSRKRRGVMKTLLGLHKLGSAREKYRQERLLGTRSDFRNSCSNMASVFPDKKSKCLDISSNTARWRRKRRVVYELQRKRGITQRHQEAGWRVAWRAIKADRSTQVFSCNQRDVYLNGSCMYICNAPVGELQGWIMQY